MKSRLVLVVFLAMMAVIIMTGCSDKSTEAKEDKSDLLIGTWTEQSVTVDGEEETPDYNKLTVTFEEDGTYTVIMYYDEGNVSEDGTYSTSGSTLTLSGDGDGFTYSYSITGSKSAGYTLTLSGTVDTDEDPLEIKVVLTRGN